jgi:hypothetical protein
MEAQMPEDAFDPVSDLELMELRSLVERAGEETALPLLMAVSGVDGVEELRLVTRREWATLRIALTVAASADGA